MLQILPTNAQGTEHNLTQFYTPAAGTGYQDMYRSGWLPSWFNQQWGGSQWGMLPDGSFGSVATGNIQDDTFGLICDNSIRNARGHGFKLSEAITSPTVWIKVYKVGNPTDNINVSIYSDNGGVPNAVIGSVGTIPGKTVTSKADGEWYSVAVPCGALSANTQYHVVIGKSGGVDATNYYVAKLTAVQKYPLGAASILNAAVWGALASYGTCFLIQNTSTTSILQASGQFDYKAVFAPGTPVNQSRSLAQPLVNFYDGKTATVLFRGAYAVSTNVVDYLYGLDHDRFTLTINASGYPVLSIYRQDGTLSTITGASSVTTGFHDVGFRIRTFGDGADYATLYVDGASVGTPLTAQTFTMSSEFARLGTARLGDGFGLAPTWTGNAMTNNTLLPSNAANGTWTWTGTATEANAMSMQGGKLYQNATGYTSTQSGYYAKTVTFNNTTGWTVSVKLRNPTSINALHGGFNGDVEIAIVDGTKQLGITWGEYFLSIGASITTPDFIIQGDFKSQEHVFTICGKGSDYYLFMDGKLVIDGTGKLTSATGTNQILFGDVSATASENADAIWSYVKYYTGGMLLPAATTGSCSEFAHWTGDKSAIFPQLWNAGTPLSLKFLNGMSKNYAGDKEGVVQNETRGGVVASPATTSTTITLLGDMEIYVIGSEIESEFSGVFTNTTSGYSTSNIRVDGVAPQSGIGSFQATSLTFGTYSGNLSKVIPGLHKIEGCFATGSGTITSNINQRRLKIRVTN